MLVQHIADALCEALANTLDILVNNLRMSLVFLGRSAQTHDPQMTLMIGAGSSQPFVEKIKDAHNQCLQSTNNASSDHQWFDTVKNSYTRFRALADVLTTSLATVCTYFEGQAVAHTFAGHSQHIAGIVEQLDGTLTSSEFQQVPLPLGISHTWKELLGSLEDTLIASLRDQHHLGAILRIRSLSKRSMVCLIHVVGGFLALFPQDGEKQKRFNAQFPDYDTLRRHAQLHAAKLTKSLASNSAHRMDKALERDVVNNARSFITNAGSFFGFSAEHLITEAALSDDTSVLSDPALAPSLTKLKHLSVQTGPALLRELAAACSQFDQLPEYAAVEHALQLLDALLAKIKQSNVPSPSLQKMESVWQLQDAASPAERQSLLGSTGKLFQTNVALALGMVQSHANTNHRETLQTLNAKLQSLMCDALCAQLHSHLPFFIFACADQPPRHSKTLQLAEDVVVALIQLLQVFRLLLIDFSENHRNLAQRAHTHCVQVRDTFTALLVHCTREESISDAVAALKAIAERLRAHADNKISSSSSSPDESAPKTSKDSGKTQILQVQKSILTTLLDTNNGCHRLYQHFSSSTSREDLQLVHASIELLEKRVEPGFLELINQTNSLIVLDHHYDWSLPTTQSDRIERIGENISPLLSIVIHNCASLIDEAVVVISRGDENMLNNADELNTYAEYIALGVNEIHKLLESAELTLHRCLKRVDVATKALLSGDDNESITTLKKQHSSSTNLSSQICDTLDQLKQVSGRFAAAHKGPFLLELIVDATKLYERALLLIGRQSSAQSTSAVQSVFSLFSTNSDCIPELTKGVYQIFFELTLSETTPTDRAIAQANGFVQSLHTAIDRLSQLIQTNMNPVLNALEETKARVERAHFKFSQQYAQPTTEQKKNQPQSNDEIEDSLREIRDFLENACTSLSEGVDQLGTVVATSRDGDRVNQLLGENADLFGQHVGVWIMTKAMHQRAGPLADTVSTQWKHSFRMAAHLFETLIAALGSGITLLKLGGTESEFMQHLSTAQAAIDTMLYHLDDGSIGVQLLDEAIALVEKLHTKLEAMGDGSQLVATGKTTSREQLVSSFRMARIGLSQLFVTFDRAVDQLNDSFSDGSMLFSTTSEQLDVDEAGHRARTLSLVYETLYNFLLRACSASLISQATRSIFAKQKELSSQLQEFLMCARRIASDVAHGGLDELSTERGSSSSGLRMMPDKTSAMSASVRVMVDKTSAPQGTLVHSKNKLLALLKEISQLLFQNDESELKMSNALLSIQSMVMAIQSNLNILSENQSNAKNKRLKSLFTTTANQVSTLTASTTEQEHSTLHYARLLQSGAALLEQVKSLTKQFLVVRSAGAQLSSGNMATTVFRLERSYLRPFVTQVQQTIVNVDTNPKFQQTIYQTLRVLLIALGQLLRLVQTIEGDQILQACATIMKHDDATEKLFTSQYTTSSDASSSSSSNGSDGSLAKRQRTLRQSFVNSNAVGTARSFTAHSVLLRQVAKLFNDAFGQLTNTLKQATRQLVGADQAAKTTLKTSATQLLAIRSPDYTGDDSSSRSTSKQAVKMAYDACCDHMAAVLSNLCDHGALEQHMNLFRTAIAEFVEIACTIRFSCARAVQFKLLTSNCEQALKAAFLLVKRVRVVIANPNVLLPNDPSSFAQEFSMCSLNLSAQLDSLLDCLLEHATSSQASQGEFLLGDDNMRNSAELIDSFLLDQNDRSSMGNVGRGQSFRSQQRGIDLRSDVRETFNKMANTAMAISKMFDSQQASSVSSQMLLYLAKLVVIDSKLFEAMQSSARCSNAFGSDHLWANGFHLSAIALCNNVDGFFGQLKRARNSSSTKLTPQGQVNVSASEFRALIEQANQIPFSVQNMWAIVALNVPESSINAYVEMGQMQLFVRQKVVVLAATLQKIIDDATQDKDVDQHTDTNPMIAQLEHRMLSLKGLIRTTREKNANPFSGRSVSSMVNDTKKQKRSSWVSGKSEQPVRNALRQTIL